jgi:dihydrofolate reductase
MAEPKLGMIVAATPAGGIGLGNKLPWNSLKGDLKNFRTLTMGQVVIMGRRTFESIGKPLDGRVNIVIAGSNYEYWEGLREQYPDAEVHYVFDLKTALTLAKSFATEWVWFIGGAWVFENAMKIVERVAVTLVHEPYECDVFIKDFGFPNEEWRKSTSVTVFIEDEGTQLGKPSHTYLEFVRKYTPPIFSGVFSEVFNDIFKTPSKPITGGADNAGTTGQTGPGTP